MSNPARFNEEKVGDMLIVMGYITKEGYCEEYEKLQLVKSIEGIVEDFYENPEYQHLGYISEYLNKAQPNQLSFNSYL